MTATFYKNRYNIKIKFNIFNNLKINKAVQFFRYIVFVQILLVFVTLLFILSVKPSKAVFTNNTAAWGWNIYGQLGDGTTINRFTPVLANINNVKDLSAGGHSSYALMENGTLWAWGGGILGDGSINRNPPIPVPNSVQVKDPNDTTGFLTGVMAVSDGDGHVLAIKEDGTVRAWGSNIFGELGDGTTTDRAFPIQVKGVDGQGFLTEIIAVAAGSTHNLALKQDGTVWAWGWNTKGELGNNTQINSLTPVQVVDPNDSRDSVGLTVGE